MFCVRDNHDMHRKQSGTIHYDIKIELQLIGLSCQQLGTMNFVKNFPSRDFEFIGCELRIPW